MYKGPCAPAAWAHAWACPPHTSKTVPCVHTLTSPHARTGPRQQSTHSNSNGQRTEPDGTLSILSSGHAEYILKAFGHEAPGFCFDAGRAVRAMPRATAFPSRESPRRSQWTSATARRVWERGCCWIGLDWTRFSAGLLLPCRSHCLGARRGAQRPSAGRRTGGHG